MQSTLLYHLCKPTLDGVLQRDRVFGFYAIDDEVRGYGFMWWTYREPRFQQYGMVLALGVWPPWRTNDSRAWWGSGATFDAGDRERAMAAYEKSLELNPSNSNARHMIERTRQGGAGG